MKGMRGKYMEKTKLPAFLRDRKKIIILVIVVLAMILSFFSNLFVGTAIVSSSVFKKSGLKIKNLSITSIFKSKTRLNGSYINDYVSEILTFRKDGGLEYVLNGDFYSGSYEINADKIKLTINGIESEFTLVDTSNDKLVFTNGEDVFSFTKTK